MGVKPMDPTYRPNLWTQPHSLLMKSGDCAHASATRCGPDSACMTGNPEVIPGQKLYGRSLSISSKPVSGQLPRSRQLTPQGPKAE
jgi:hypothetical protein